MTIIELTEYIANLKLNLFWETNYLEVKKNSGVWGWFLSVKKEENGAIKRFQLSKYADYKKLGRELMKYQQKTLFQND